MELIPSSYRQFSELNLFGVVWLAGKNNDGACEELNDMEMSSSNCEHSAVFSSLPLAIKWLRDRVQQNQSTRLQVKLIKNYTFKLNWRILDWPTKLNYQSIISYHLHCSWLTKMCMVWLMYQVLVTGSIHLIGDVLKLIKKWFVGLNWKTWLASFLILK